MAEVVAHPETGQPAVAETSYRVIELDLERAKLTELEAQLEPCRAEAQAANEKLSGLESAVEEQKSLIARAEAIQPQSDTSGEGVGNGEETAAEATDSTVAGDLEAGDAGDGAVHVPVTEVPADEY